MTETETPVAIEELLRRVETAERKAARWRLQAEVALLVLVAGLAAGAFWVRSAVSSRFARLEESAAAREKVVEAEAFVVRDPSGKKLASFGLPDRKGSAGSFHERFQSGSACLEIYDKAGVGRVDLGLKGLALFGPDQALNVWLLSGEETWGVAVNDPKKQGTAFFASVAGGTYSLYTAEPPDRNGMRVELGEAKAEAATP